MKGKKEEGLDDREKEIVDAIKEGATFIGITRLMALREGRVLFDYLVIERLMSIIKKLAEKE